MVTRLEAFEYPTPWFVGWHGKTNLLLLLTFDGRSLPNYPDKSQRITTDTGKSSAKIFFFLSRLCAAVSTGR